jgi:hypothetical protein
MKFTLGKKPGMGFGVVLALMIASAALTQVQASSIKETQDQAIDVDIGFMVNCLVFSKEFSVAMERASGKDSAG